MSHSNYFNSTIKKINKININKNLEDIRNKVTNVCKLLQFKDVITYIFEGCY